MKSGSSSAIAFGSVLQAVRKRLGKSQADVASSFSPALSVAAVSMAESGSRPPKTEAIVRGYALALELDDDALVELWWATQGIVQPEEWETEQIAPRWWKDLRPSHEAVVDHHFAEEKARRRRTPNEDHHAPSLRLFAFAEAICAVLHRMLGETWKVRYKYELGLREPIEGYPSAVIIELRAGGAKEGTSPDSPELITAFACPDPRTPPAPPTTTTRPETGSLSPDVAWILSAVTVMPARERSAVAGFIHGLREGANLFSGTPEPSHTDPS